MFLLRLSYVRAWHLTCRADRDLTKFAAMPTQSSPPRALAPSETARAPPWTTRQSFFSFRGLLSWAEHRQLRRPTSTTNAAAAERFFFVAVVFAPVTSGLV